MAPPNTTKTRPWKGAIGVTGLPQFSGYILDEWLPALQGSQGRRIYREMSDNDPVIGAFLFAIEMILRGATWSMLPGSDDAVGEKQAAFATECLHDMEITWPDTLAEILSYIVYGWSLHEIVYKPRRGGEGSAYTDNRIGWKGWPIRGQETLLRWDFDGDGAVEAMIQLGPPDYATHVIPLARSLLFRTTAKRGNPEGRSALRNCYTSYYYQKNIQAIEAIGIERDLAGLPVAKVPAELTYADAPAADQALYASIKQMVTSIKRDEQEGIVWPQAWDEDNHELYTLELLSTGGTRSFDTDKILGRYAQRIAMTVLADFILLGHEEVGTQALGGTKADLFTVSLSAWADMICAQVNIALRRLMAVNGMDVRKSPTMSHGRITRSDVVALSTMLNNLTSAGIQLDTRPDGPLARHVLEEADLPAPEPGDIAELQKAAQAQDDADHKRALEMASVKAPAAQAANGNGNGNGKAPAGKEKGP